MKILNPNGAESHEIVLEIFMGVMQHFRRFAYVLMRVCVTASDAVRAAIEPFLVKVKAYTVKFLRPITLYAPEAHAGYVLALDDYVNRKWKRPSFEALVDRCKTSVEAPRPKGYQSGLLDVLEKDLINDCCCFFLDSHYRLQTMDVATQNNSIVKMRQLSVCFGLFLQTLFDRIEPSGIEYPQLHEVVQVLVLAFNLVGSPPFLEKCKIVLGYIRAVQHRCLDTDCINRAGLKCGKCELARYCSAECQRKTWPFHKKSCSKPGFTSFDEIKEEFIRSKPWCDLLQLYENTPI